LATLVAAVAVSTALAFSTCAAAGTPTRASWTAAANGICSAGNAQIRRLPKSTAPDVRAANFRVISRIVNRENAKLSVLPRPVSELPNISFFLSKARALVPLYDQAARAEATRDKPALTRVLTMINTVGSWYDFAARVLGARVCAEAS
jgi:hypothetical protein